MRETAERLEVWIKTYFAVRCSRRLVNSALQLEGVTCLVASVYVSKFVYVYVYMDMWLHKCMYCIYIHMYDACVLKIMLRFVKIAHVAALSSQLFASDSSKYINIRYYAHMYAFMRVKKKV